MSSSEILKTVNTLILSMSLMMAGYGMFSTFLSIRMEIEGFSNQAIGLQTSAFYAGVVIGSLFCAKLINRVGHIRAFAAFCGASATCILLFPFFKFLSVWILLRGILGVLMAGQYMVVESWLNARTTTNTRGTVLAVYMMAVNFAIASSQLALNLADPAGPEFFMLGAAFYALALIPVSLSISPYPDPVDPKFFSFFKLFKISPVAVSGCIANGMVLGAILGLTPIFIKGLGHGIEVISIFMALYMISGLIFQFPIGKLSDIYDRRIIILAVCGVLAISSLPLIIFSNPGIILLYIIAVLLGATSQTLYPLCISYANDYLNPEDLVKASGGLVLSYGVGAAIGPSAAAAIMEITSPRGMFVFILIVTIAYILFTLYRMTKRASPTDKDSFQVLPDAISMPVGLEIDPRYEEENANRNTATQPQSE